MLHVQTAEFPSNHCTTVSPPRTFTHAQARGTLPFGFLEVKLKKMLNHFDQSKTKQRQTIHQPGAGNIIRRRNGEKEKRFYSIDMLSS